jgi:hypothetical protein
MTVTILDCAKVFAAFLILVYSGMWSSYQWRKRKFRKDGF